MKKIFTTILAASLMLVGVEAFAQVSAGAGWVNSTMTNKVGNTKTSTNSNGFYLGASYNLDIAKGFAVAPGVYYEFLAGKNDGLVEATDTEHYLDVPVMFNYGFDLASDCRLFVFAGPTLQFGLASTLKTTIASVETKVNRYDGMGYGRFDCLLGAGVGFQINAINVKVGYNYGMVNRYTDAPSDTALHRSAIHLGVGFAF